MLGREALREYALGCLHNRDEVLRAHNLSHQADALAPLATLAEDSADLAT